MKRDKFWMFSKITSRDKFTKCDDNMGDVRPRRWRIAALVAIILGLPTKNAGADDSGQLTVGAGLFDLVSHHEHDGELLVSYEFGQGLFDGNGSFRGLKPFVAGMADNQKAVFGYAGLAAPFLWDNGKWEFEPSAGMGAYHKGEGINLGGTFEFGLGLGLSRAVGDHARIGIELTHISNACIYAKDPGVNSALVTWSWFFKH